jgi:hypothetical protein
MFFLWQYDIFHIDIQHSAPQLARKPHRIGRSQFIFGGLSICAFYKRPRIKKGMQPLPNAALDLD